MIYYFDFTERTYDHYRLKIGTIYQINDSDRDDVTGTPVRAGDWVHLTRNVVLRKLIQFG